MADYDLYQMQKKLEKYLDEHRFLHTLGVTYTCASLAMVHDYNLMDAQVAGLLHDSAKCIPNKKKLSMCQEHQIPVTDFERSHPFLLHLSAITWHTTGKPQMSKLEKLLYIADYIEPLRDKARHLDQIRKLAFQDLDLCMYEILWDTLTYLDSGTGEIDGATREAYEYYSLRH